MRHPIHHPRDRQHPKNVRRGARRTLVGRAGTWPARRLESYRRSVPVTTISTARLPQLEHTSRSRQSRTLVAAPYCRAISIGSGSTWWPHALRHTISRTRAAAESRVSSVRFAPLAPAFLNQLVVSPRGCSMGSVIVSRRLAAGFHPAQSGRHGTSVQNAPRRSGFAWTHRWREPDSNHRSRVTRPSFSTPAHVTCSKFGLCPRGWLLRRCRFKSLKMLLFYAVGGYSTRVNFPSIKELVDPLIP